MYMLQDNERLIVYCKQTSDVPIYFQQYAARQQHLSTIYTNNQNILLPLENIVVTTATSLQEITSQHLTDLPSNTKLLWLELPPCDTVEESTKIIAYYLPQYHTIPENDKWWGKNFTEWTNVRKAKPVFPGHDQPKLPLEYYDLADPTTIHDQIELAKKYNIHGFCFHYYWFAGKRLLELPIENYLQDASPQADFPFMLCWANEDWTRTWDGKSGEILIGQKHSVADHRRAAKDLLRYFQDPRYIKVNNKPALIIYRVELIKELQKFKDILEAEAAKVGIPGIHLISTTASYRFDPDLSGMVQHVCDGVAEFPPHTGFDNAIKPVNVDTSTDFTGFAYDYVHYKNRHLQGYDELLNTKLETAYYPGCFPGWDNTARRPDSSHICVGNSPEQFEEWITAGIQYTNKKNTSQDNFIFINAWNEWAEGAVLEPTVTDGYNYVHAVSKAYNKSKQDKITAYQIYYQKEQLSNIMPGFQAHYNKKSTVYLESGIINDLITRKKHLKSDWFGVFSWKVQDKVIGFSNERMQECVKNNRLSPSRGCKNYDMISISRENAMPGILPWGSHNPRELHVEQWPVFDALINKMYKQGIISRKPFFDRDMNFIYCNCFLAKTHIYEDFVKTTLRPAINLFKKDKDLYNLGTTNLPRTDHGKPPQRFTDHTGYEEWPHIPFVLERLINVYVELNDLKVGWIL